MSLIQNTDYTSVADRHKGRERKPSPCLAHLSQVL
jgi:hypothetical protein